jgi:hypothetical protein
VNKVALGGKTGFDPCFVQNTVRQYLVFATSIWFLLADLARNLADHASSRPSKKKKQQQKEF